MDFLLLQTGKECFLLSSVKDRLVELVEVRLLSSLFHSYIEGLHFLHLASYDAIVPLPAAVFFCFHILK